MDRRAQGVEGDDSRGAREAMKPITKFKLMRRPGLRGWNWLWGKARTAVVRKGVRRWYRVPLGVEILCPNKTQGIGFGSLLEAWSLLIIVYRGRRPDDA